MSDQEEGDAAEGAATTGLSPVQRIMKLFSGFEGAHGTHGASEQKSGGVKHEIKKSAKTVREPVTEALWGDHLAGRRALGVIPIRRDGTCLWGVIDVDKYDISHTDLYRQLEERALPLVVLKSKSGGAHLALFLQTPQTALDVRSLLHGIAASMGLGQCEIFPKQVEILSESGDLGNWLNMPYLRGDETERYAVTRNGGAMTLEQFLDYAEARSLDNVTFEDLISIRPAERAKPRPAKRRARGEGGDESPDVPPLADGPPCLEHLAAAGFGEGMRNNGLFALGVYCQKRYGNGWREKLEDFNQAYMNPPISADELVQVQTSLGRQEYQYSCKQPPLCTHCNQGLCRTRKHGITSSGDYPVITSLSVLDTDPPVWFLDVEDERLEVTTDELQTYRAFQKIIMERLHKCFKPLKQETWLNMISQIMQSVIVIEAPEEVSRKGHFVEVLTEFLTNRQKGQRIEDLHSGRPFEDEAGGRHYFRLRDLQAYLIREGIQNMSRGQITTRIRDLGGNDKFQIVKGRGLRTWWVPRDAVEPPVSIDPPEVQKEPM